jgi:hypothetical protein
MSRSVLSIPAALFLVACGKPPVEAPTGLNDVSRFLLVNFENEGPEELAAGVLNIEAELDGLNAFDAEEIDERAFTMAVLRSEDLGGMPAHEGFDPDSQIPVAVAGRSSFDLSAQMRIVEETNHICIESETTKFYRREFDSDLACFLDGSCLTLATRNEVFKDASILGSVWYDQPKEYRKLTLEDGREVMVARSFTPEVFETVGGGGSFDQTYTLEVWIPDGSTTKRFYSIWSSVTLGVVGDDLWASLVRSGIDEGYRFADDYLADFAGELCGNDLDRPYDRP